VLRPAKQKQLSACAWLGAAPKVAVAISVGLILVVVVAYWGIGANSFVQYDDQVYITENFNLDRGFSSTGLSWAFSTFTANNWHPVTWLSHMLDVSVLGRHAAWHHRENVLLHAVNSVLLFLILLRLTGRQWPSAAVAALFAVHPLNVESVAWAAERKNLLSTLFWLLAMAAYVRYVDRPSIARYSLVAVCLALGLMSKPMLVTLPFALLLIDYWPLQRVSFNFAESSATRDVGKPTWQKLLLEKTPLIALAIGSSVATFRMQAKPDFTLLPLPQRLGNAVVSYVEYLRKLCWPFDLAALYPHPRGQLAIGWVVACLVLLVAITALVIWQAKRRPYLPVGWFWYLGTLVPVIGVVQVGSQAMADRYAYVPTIGVFLIIAWGVADLSAAWPRRQWVLGAAATALLLALTWLTNQQMRVWRDTGTLFANALRVNHANDVAHFLYANDLLRTLDKSPAHAAQRAEAIKHLREAARLSPGDEEFALGLAGALVWNGEFAEANAMLDRVLAQSPQSLAALNQRGVLLLERNDLLLAIADFKRVIQLAGASRTDDKALAQAHFGLGVAYARQGDKEMALEQFNRVLALNATRLDARLYAGRLERELGHHDRALQHFTEAARYHPDSVDAQNELALALVHQGHPEQAIERLRQVVAARAGDATARLRLGQLLISQGHRAQGIEQLEAAVRLRPTWELAINDLAWHLATTDGAPADAQRALELATSVNRDSKSDKASHLDTLAAAYAATGQYQQAVTTAEQAREAAIAADDISFATRIESRRQLYAAGKPYRAQP
jgi:tetratricopeptide (TPR) repeat protein